MTDKPHFPSDDLKVDFGTKIIKEASDPKRLADFRRQDDERHEAEVRKRAARARADAIAAFSPFHRTSTEGVLWECPGCGGLVLDRERHFDWHGILADTARDAHDAAWRGRPIG